MIAPSANESVLSCSDTGLACSGRRAVLRGAAALGAVSLLAACGGGGEKKDTAAPAQNGTDAPPVGGTDTKTPSAEASETPAGGSSGGGKVLGATSEIPVGGGKTFEDEGVIVTQPTAGDFRAFTSVCTHTGCTIYETEGGTMNCGCHGSKFSDKDGSVVKGPADAPLAKKSVTVKGGNLTLA